ncbi:hypothetical protein ACFOPQ_04185 [Deinococcus antarcticus]|uniref:Uncharacterized protein n=1 Tax=Deinococcus antarcticus TaxID=1298767 RepID=A0ABV8A3V0_9DEIO
MVEELLMTPTEITRENFEEVAALVPNWCEEMLKIGCLVWTFMYEGEPTGRMVIWEDPWRVESWGWWCVPSGCGKNYHIVEGEWDGSILNATFDGLYEPMRFNKAGEILDNALFDEEE